GCGGRHRAGTGHLPPDRDRPRRHHQRAQSTGRRQYLLGTDPAGRSPRHFLSSWWKAASATSSHGPSWAWYLANDALTFRAIGVRSDCSRTTSAESFRRSCRTGRGNCTSSTLLLNFVLSCSSAAEFLSWNSVLPWMCVDAAARSRICFRSAGRASYALRLKPKSLTVPGSCQPG